MTPSGDGVLIATAYDDLAFFDFDGATGALTPVNGSPIAGLDNPTHLAVHPSGQFVYVCTNSGLRGYQRSTSTGELTELGGSPFASSVDFSFTSILPNGDFLLASSSTDANVRVYAINGSTGALTETGTPANLGGNHYAWTMRADGSQVYATHSGTQLSILDVNPTTGALAPHPGSPITLNDGAFDIGVFVVP